MRNAMVARLSGNHEEFYHASSSGKKVSLRLTNREALPVLCSAAKHVGRKKRKEKYEM